MKRKFLYSVFGAFALALIIGMASCQKINDVANDVRFILDTDVLNHSVTVQFLDLEGKASDLQGNLDIDIIGKDSDKIYSVLGKENVQADGNFLNLSIRKTEAPTPENPLEFTVVAKAPGFLPAYKTLYISHDSLQMVSVPMVQLGEDIKGVSSLEDNFLSDAAETVSFSTPMAFGKEEKAAININQGTKLYTKSGEELSGEVRVELVHFDNRSSESFSTFPGGLTSRNMKAVDGTNMGSVGFTPLGLISLDMYVDGKEVRSFSQPLDVTIDVNPNSINPHTGQKVQAGDEVYVSSFNEETAEWETEKMASISQNPQGKLVINYQQEHLSRWHFGFVNVGCSLGLIRVSSEISRWSSNWHLYYAEVINAATDMPVTETGFYARFYDGEGMVFQNPPDIEAYLRIYDGTDACPGNLLIETNSFPLCGFTFNERVEIGDALRLDDFLNAYVEVSGFCVDDNLEVRPTLPILFKDPENCENEDEFALLGVMRGGKGSTTMLKLGGIYDFKICYGGIDRDLRDVEIPAEDTDIIINNAEFGFQDILRIRYINDSRGGKRLKFIYHDIPIPASACDIWRDHLDIVEANDLNGDGELNEGDGETVFEGDDG